VLERAGLIRALGAAHIFATDSEAIAKASEHADAEVIGIDAGQAANNTQGDAIK
jgi:hypothetical protein